MFEGLLLLKDIAELLFSLQDLFEDGELNDPLNELLKDLQDLRLQLVRGINQILAAVGEIAHQIDEDVAFDNMALADRALFNDLGVFNDKQAAMGNSFEAADRLVREADVVFAPAFMYVVNIRLAVLKDFDPGFPCKPEFRDEIQRYIDRLEGWITQLNDLIRQLHTVEVEKVTEPVEDVYPPTSMKYWMATHFRDGVIVQRFFGPIDDVSQTARSRVERQARDSRSAGIAADRQSLGVVDMEGTARAWAEMLGTNLRLALVSQVLNRPVRAIDFNADGLMVDGRIVPAGPDLRTTLIDLLNSREFRSRLERSWDAFVDRDDDTLVQFAHRRLFDREATEDETGALRQIARQYGYGAFIAALMYSDEYAQHFGRGLPGTDRPIAEELELQQ